MACVRSFVVLDGVLQLVRLCPSVAFVSYINFTHLYGSEDFFLLSIVISNHTFGPKIFVSFVLVIGVFV